MTYKLYIFYFNTPAGSEGATSPVTCPSCDPMQGVCAELSQYPCSRSIALNWHLHFYHYLQMLPFLSAPVEVLRGCL